MYFVLFVLLSKILELNPAKIPPIVKNKTPFFPIVSKNKKRIAIVLNIFINLLFFKVIAQSIV